MYVYVCVFVCVCVCVCVLVFYESLYVATGWVYICSGQNIIYILYYNVPIQYVCDDCKLLTTNLFIFLQRPKHMYFIGYDNNLYVGTYYHPVVYRYNACCSSNDVFFAQNRYDSYYIILYPVIN